MSLARALTTRRQKPQAPSNDAYLGRAASQRAPNAKPIKRTDISLPVELLSSTNVLTYDAPNIPNAPNARDRRGGYFNPSTLSSAISVGSSNNSDNDSDNTASDHSHDTDATSVDLSSPETANDQFSHFGKNPVPKSSGTLRSARSTTSSQASNTIPLYTDLPVSTSDKSPKVPERSPTHTRRAHVLSHTRSVLSRENSQTQQSSSAQQSSSSSSSSDRRDSFDMFNAQALNSPVAPRSKFNTAPPSPAAVAPPTNNHHPFGKELEQLNEAAAEFGSAVRDAETEADVAAMSQKGLIRFCATDYMDAISELSPFGQASSAYQQPAMAWI